MIDRFKIRCKKKTLLVVIFFLSNFILSGYLIGNKYNYQQEFNNSYSINEVHYSGSPDIGVQEGDKYIYILVEKEQNFKDYLPQLNTLINATYWMVLLNYTRNMDDINEYGQHIVPIVSYFDTEYYYVWPNNYYRISSILEQNNAPGIEGIAEWNYYDNDDHNDVTFGSTAINKLLDGTSYQGFILPGLVGDAQSGQGVLDFLELYNKALTDQDLRSKMTIGYGADWRHLGILADYYNQYFVPNAITKLKPYAREYVPEVEFMDVLNQLYEGNEVKGEYACSKINSIEEYTDSWQIVIDKWDYTSNMEDFSDTPADKTLTLNVYKNAQDLGKGITLANLTLREQDIIPIIVNDYLNNINWLEDVKVQGNSITEMFYSGNIETLPFGSIDLTFNMTYDNNGMLSSMSLYSDVEITSHYTLRLTFYQLSIYHKPNEEGIPGGDNGGGSPFTVDAQTIALSSISIFFAFAFMMIIKKPRGYRR